MNDTQRTVFQPYVVSRLPDEKEPTAIVPNTRKSLSDCTRVRSSGRWHSSTRAEAPTKPKFQPTPSRIRVIQKCATSIPVSPMAADAAVKASPAATTRGAPKRVISRPVKKPGAYIAMMCHCRPQLDDSCDRPHRRIAKGAAVMTKFMSVYET